MLNSKVPIKKLTQIKQSISLHDENELKNCNHLIHLILEFKAILKKMVVKIYYFNEYTNILKRLVVLAIMNIFILGNLHICLIKRLILLLRLVILLLQNLAIMVVKKIKIQ